MLGLTLAKILALLSRYGYAIIFPISIIEGPMVSVLAGFLVSVSRLNGIVVFAILIAGDLIGDTLYYALGRWSRGGFIRRWGKYLGVTEERVHKLEKYYSRHAGKIIILGKTQPIGSAILFAGGFVKMPYWEFIGYNLIGTLPKVALLEIIGIYFGRGYATISNYLNYAGVVSFTLAVVLLGGYWLLKKYIRSKNKEFESLDA